MPGTLYLVGTPIGNLEDITLRALTTLRAVDLIACEDTRETRKLLAHFHIDKPLTSYHEHNQRGAGPRLIEQLQAGQSIAVVTDAGMPGISDPGTALVAEAIAAGIPVVPIPGPTAFVAALVASGLPTDRFAFEGFLPREPKLRRRRLRELVHEPRTLIFYEAPHRVAETLADMAETLGPERRASVGRELTKRFETFQRGRLDELAVHYTREAPRGEFVLVLEGGQEASGPAENWREALSGLLESGMKATEAAKAIAKSHGVNRQEAYEAALAIRENAPS
ncbi:MAG TPA: 16S rRNA (cytidine(1402)-2'-O)-methyltransferase [Oscillatoriaceae cyanobacterium]